MSKKIEIKDGPSALRALKKAIEQDDRRGAEGSAGCSQKRLSPTQVAVFGPPGTRRATYQRLIVALGGGHIETQTPGRSAGPKAKPRLCIVFDVGYQAPAKRGPKAAA